MRKLKLSIVASIVMALISVTTMHPANAGGYYGNGYYGPYGGGYYGGGYYGGGYGYDGYGYGYRTVAFFGWPLFSWGYDDDYCHQRVRIYDNWGGWVWGHRIVC